MNTHHSIDKNNSDNIISKMIDILPLNGANLYDTYSVKCEYLTPNKDVKIYYPSNKYSIVVNNCNYYSKSYNKLESELTYATKIHNPFCNIDTLCKPIQDINYISKTYKNLPWTMQNL